MPECNSPYLTVLASDQSSKTEGRKMVELVYEVKAIIVILSLGHKIRSFFVTTYGRQGRRGSWNPRQSLFTRVVQVPKAVGI